MIRHYFARRRARAERIATVRDLHRIAMDAQNLVAELRSVGITLLEFV